MDQLLVTLILVTAMVLLITERIPVDLTALGVIAALLATGILTPGEALCGFSNQAPVTVGGLFIVSRGLIRTGALDTVTRFIMAVTRGRPGVFLGVCLLITGACSSFINNSPVVVLFIPVIMAVCGRYGLAPSVYLMPVSFVSILAGTSTLLGTSTNIIVSDLGASAGFEPLSMFELTPIGFPIAFIGAIFIYFLAPRLLPRHRTPLLEKADPGAHKYLSELVVPEGSALAGKEPLTALKTRYPELEIYEVIQGDQVLDPSTDACLLAPGGHPAREGHGLRPGWRSRRNGPWSSPMRRATRRPGPTSRDRS